MASTFSLPPTYRAYVYEAFGDALDVIKLRSDVPFTPLASTQVRIKVHSASVNPVDYKIIEFGGKYLPSSPSAENPFRVGFDAAGTVVEVGSDVTHVKAGDAVFAKTTFGLAGSFAEYFDLDAKYVALKPKNMSFLEAASVPGAGQTTYQSLVNYGKIKPGDRVLILGGSSGTGIFGIQIARALGASFIAATTSTRNVELVKSLGVDQVIDYTREKWSEVLEPHSIDLLYDCGVEPLAWNDAAQIVLKPDTGIFVTINPQVPLNKLDVKTECHQVKVQSNTADLETLSRFIEEGKMVTVIDTVYTFDNLLEAIRHIKTGRARGKIVIDIIPDKS
ncbi:hypothetical protein Poli38472_010003 [Pythium oligandrum]|uniref:Enoyl reductase (ER) domain-containing protein n=1 Tax=Pythium oligandrum TaxID=41045 RepID=A0A8K1C8J6_PYTOL|nr:hypothetical protein Poli38472_010003 [Pythium oligandrum]|eukprot:TMW58444.1 hypothetical protein Poli38472_010003 [Pythium oligandrum]